ncbi:DUF2339 domain-containing protein [Stenotrophomonas sp. C3(2023)]|uniref:DUF2339 domain-containing protein n=1 Tax=Stenotrophomonas sp. C3(2023) TaxID=3080277 RepID=UPI00293C295F|nr:DUF2339 domain-containing protein [Stenotrophomonas sp. C3(2023)]MDV3467703.1 DUF2339 domain-containing protein [Stenotrophomonas sp. C3(2023)]
MEGLLVVLGLMALAIPVLLLIALVMIMGLRRRVDALERQLVERASVAPLASVDTVRARTVEPGPVSVPDPAPAPVPPPVAAAPPPLPSPSQSQRAAAQSTADASIDPAPVAGPPPVPRGPGMVERALQAGKRWFTEGNVPVKVGMLVFMAGIAALLKYVSDQGLLDVPIELRLVGITVAALVLLAFGWRQRERRALFALALQGGAIGVLLLTVFAAFKRYDLIPAAAAFAASIALVAGMCVLAVVQNSRTLAVLGILAGFMAPLWLSTGAGSHVALFSYYAVLNAGIFAIAWKRAWRVLNLLGFAFTFGIGTVWGVLVYRPEHLHSTQPFLLLFFAFYLLIPLLNARRQSARQRDIVDGSLLFGTPLVAFSLQAALLDGQPMTLALLAVGLAALYALLARALIGRPGWIALAQSYAVLAVGFATLAVPLALSARATGAVFALEGAGLVWLGLRQRRLLPQITGALLQVAAAFAFVAGADHWHTDAVALLNPTSLGALLLAVAGFASAWSCRQYGRRSVALVYYLWGLLWWLGGMVHEVIRFAPTALEPDLLLCGLALSAWLAAEVHRRLPSPVLALTTLCMLAMAFPLALWQCAVHQQPFAGHGGIAWLAMAVLGTRALLALRGGAGLIARVVQFVWLLLWPTVLSLATIWLSGQYELAEGWRVLLVLLPWLALTALSLLRWSWLSLPLGVAFAPARLPLQLLLFAGLGLAWLGIHLIAGRATPLPWLPVLNPAELAQWASLVLFARWLYSGQAPDALQRRRVPLLAIAGFVALTSLVLHGVHHWGQMRWSPALVSSSLAQTSLTVLWSVLGVIAWVWGSRRGQRALWVVGAVLMAVVLAKLVLIDRQHLGNLLGIASFIAYGLLCTVVGYLAPAPPRAGAEQGEAA